MEIGGVSFRELTENDGMKPIRAILMLDWLRRELRRQHSNALYISVSGHRIQSFVLNQIFE
jgi:hypothetical protein